MRFFALSFWLNIKKFLKRPTFWCGLIALPIIIALGGAFMHSRASVITITAGVHFNHDNALESAIFDFLSGTPYARFVAYDDAYTLIEDVRLGRIECGYIINPNIENIREGNFSGTVTLVTSPRTIATPILNDMVSAAVLHASSMYITIDGLNQFFGESDEIKAFVNWQFAAYDEMDIFMTPIFVNIADHDGETQPGLAEITSRRVFRGVIGLTILILILFASPIFIDERRYGLQKKLSVHGILAAYDLSLFAAAFFVMFIVGLAGLISAALFVPGLLVSVRLELAAMIAFSAVCAILLILAVRLLKSIKIIHTFGLFIIIANIAFGGVVLDLTEINPELGFLQWFFPLYWYTSF